MFLNKKDTIQYKQFIDRLAIGFQDSFIDEHVLILKSFIDTYYESDEEGIFELNDFINESLLELLKYKKYESNSYFNDGLLLMTIKEIYERQRKPIVKQERKENINQLDLYDKYLYDFIHSSELNLSEKDIIIIEDFLNGVKLEETSNKINTSHQFVSFRRKVILKRIKKSEAFKEYYKEETSKLFEYEQFLKRYLISKDKKQLKLLINSICDTIEKKKRRDNIFEIIEQLESIEEYSKEDFTKYKRYILSDRNSIRKKYLS